MNTFNITDNNNETITVSTETGEVIRTGIQTAETGEGMLHAAEPKQHESASKAVKTLFFNAREWKPSKECTNTVATRSFISSPFGGLTEAYMIGDWHWNWSQIETGELILEKNTDHEFIFWLNGGENDRNQETCRLEIIFDGDGENRSIYNLNRSFIRYVRHYKGWYLYRIPFNTGNACYTKLKLISMSAYTTFIHADMPENYADLPDDPAPVGLPQRHNIIFGEDGFPRNSYWSGKVFGADTNAQSGNKGGNRNSGFSSNAFSAFDSDFFSGLSSLSAFDGDFMENVMNRVKENLEGEIDPDEIADEIADEVMDSIDVDSIKEQIIQNIKDSLS